MSISGTNLYEAARLGGGSSVIESLQSQLKLREGEIAQLQVCLGLSLELILCTITSSVFITRLWFITGCGINVICIQFLYSILVFILKMEIASLERSRTVMAEELVRLTNQNDEMESKVKEIPKMKVQLKVVFFLFFVFFLLLVM